MKRIIHLIQKRLTASFWLSSIFFLTMAVIMLMSGECLRTSQAPRGILSLELSFNHRKADRVKDEWSQMTCERDGIISIKQSPVTGQMSATLVDRAITDIWLDYLFIIAYCFFLAVFIVHKNMSTANVPVSGRTKGFLVLLFVVAVLDVFENIFMTRYLNGDNVFPAVFSIPALLKLIGIAVVVSYILTRLMQLGSDFMNRFMQTLWKNRISLVGFIIMFVALWKSDQGQDLLLNLNAHFMGPALFYLVLTILAAINWFLPKYYTDHFIQNNPAQRGVRILFANPSHRTSQRETNIPRIMGVLTFIIPACAILNALNVMRIEYSFNFIHPFQLMVITMIFYVGLVHKKVLERAFFGLHKNGLGWLFLAAIVSMFAVILIFGLLNKHAPFQLANLSIGLYLMSMIFYIVTTLRGNHNFYKIRGLAWLEHQQACNWLRHFAGLCVITFIIVSLRPLIFASWEYSRFVTLPVVFTGVIFYTAIFYVLLVLGKYSKVNWAAMVLVVGLLMAVFFDNRFHDIYRIDQKPETNLQTLDEYIDNWVTVRQQEILESRERYPVFIVNAYGGGIRAAAWTSLVVSHLDSITGGKFQRHVLAYSGASGGTIGASVMCALRKSRNGEPVHSQEVLNFYRNDFLTPVLVGLMGRDIFFSTTGWDAVDDRARLQDNTWENHLFALDHGTYAREFSSLWYDSSARPYDVPLLFANTYHVESGLKGILAPVKLSGKHFPQAVDVNEKLGERRVSLSTASFLSARFPYISPAGKLDAGHHFLDGGLKENSGAETAFELYTMLRGHKLLREDSVRMRDNPQLRKAYSKIDVYFLSLNNTGNHDAEPTTRNLVELTAPFTALYNNWVGNTLKADSVLADQVSPNYFQLRPLKDTVKYEGLTFRPVLPLGWQISDFALQRLHESLTYCNHTQYAYQATIPERIQSIASLIGDFNIKHDCGASRKTSP
ncbi:MAG: hypothetical protein WEB30_00290 [Cyclobacteriaceae bacterium]